MDKGTIILRKATHEDMNAILALLSARKKVDLQRLINIPMPFQQKFLHLEIEKGRIFVAVNKTDKTIIAQRKVFIIEDNDEQHKILSKDLRCTHAQRELIEHGFFDYNNKFFQHKAQHFNHHQKILYIYVGAAFTHPAFRGRRINEQLNAYAYNCLNDVVVSKIHTSKYSSIALTYALVEDNVWRTAHLARPFLHFARSISAEFEHQSNNKTFFYAYKRYNTQYSICPKGNLVQLPDEHCRPGRGCVLLYQLTENN